MTGAARSSMRTMRERTKEQMSSLSSSFDFRQPKERRKIERALIDYSPSFFLSDLFFEIVLLFVTSEECRSPPVAKAFSRAFRSPEGEKGTRKSKSLFLNSLKWGWLRQGEEEEFFFKFGFFFSLRFLLPFAPSPFLSLSPSLSLTSYYHPDGQ